MDIEPNLTEIELLPGARAGLRTMNDRVCYDPDDDTARLGEAEEFTGNRLECFICEVLTAVVSHRAIGRRGYGEVDATVRELLHSLNAVTTQDLVKEAWGDLAHC
ncbi:MAG: hypothetical protein WBX00_21280 [Isosphaeraceae bacterium]